MRQSRWPVINAEEQETNPSMRRSEDRVHRKYRLVLGLCVVAAVLAGAGLLAFLLFSIVSPSFIPPPFEEVRKDYQRSDAVLLDRHLEVIHELRVDHKRRRLEWVPLDGISPALQSAVLRAEDKSFFKHRGVDWLALGGVLLKGFSSENLRGASTITMQLAGKLSRELQPQSSRRSLWQKLMQIQAARQLENYWSKPQILEAYLNLVSFRGELQGIAVASRGLFDKQPHGLNNQEAVIMAALLRAPNASVDQVATRACQLSDALGLRLDPADLQTKTREILTKPYSVQPEIALAPHVAWRLLAGGRTKATPETAHSIACTLEGTLQRFAVETLERHVLSVREQNVHDGAALVVDNKTGEVLAYVGNVGNLASARYVDGTQARRQAGSILKPFLYSLAFEERLMTPASLIDDSPLDLPAVNGIYRPENYDNRFHGRVTARIALASSLNIPAVKTLNLVGIEPFVRRLGDLGIRELRTADFYGPSLALGSADVSLWDLVNAYRTLANGGLWSPLRLTFDEAPEAPPRRAVSPGAAFLIADILSDRASRSETFELESPLSTRFWTAVKTGTSKDMRDNWCVGYSSRYTVGVWAGNFSGQPMWNVSGITGAAPVWVEIMNWLHRDQPSSPPTPPAGVIARRIEISDSGESVNEWFLKGTEPLEIRPASVLANFQIVYPAGGTIIALDPDIPGEQQKVLFESRPADRRLLWSLDGEEIGSAGSALPWTPTAGKHILALVDGAMHILDSVNFEVRGAVVP